ncbi:MAG: hypothetical protein KDA92_21470 [Planctomycetales bacterium]|nr:hypothetical protein [Planctomycetales bacterium]
MSNAPYSCRLAINSPGKRLTWQLEAYGTKSEQKVIEKTRLAFAYLQAN